jgi:hypothetical protein
MFDTVIINKYGISKKVSINTSDPLYKKCNFKNDNDFGKQTSWDMKLNGKVYTLDVHAKTNGRANTENKFEFPPPIDNSLFFGSVILLLYDNVNGKKEMCDLQIETWDNIYEKLMGGFEDLTKTSDEEESDEEIEDCYLTKHGYSTKDNFVVDDDEPVYSDEEYVT